MTDFVRFFTERTMNERNEKVERAHLYRSIDVGITG